MSQQKVSDEITIGYFNYLTELIEIIGEVSATPDFIPLVRNLHQQNYCFVSAELACTQASEEKMMLQYFMKVVSWRGAVPMFPTTSIIRVRVRVTWTWGNVDLGDPRPGGT